MARGLLGRNSSIQFRHCRKEALKGADVVLLVGKSHRIHFNGGNGQVETRRSGM